MQLLKQLYDLFIIKFIFGNFNILIFAFVNLSKMTEQIFDNIYIYIFSRFMDHEHLEFKCNLRFRD